MTTQVQDYMPALLQRLRGADAPRTVELAERAAQEHPRDPRPLLILAGHLMHQGEVDRAEGAYVLALQRAPEYAIARFQLGLLQFTSARPAAAFATWAPLEQLPQTDPLLHFKRAFELLAQDRFEESRSWFRSGIAANTSNEPLNRDMEMMLRRMVDAGVIRDDHVPMAAPPGVPAPYGSAELLRGDKRDA